MTAIAHAVPQAVAGPITDEVLEQAIAAARSARDGQIDDATGALLLLTAAPLFEECLQHRRRMAVIRDLADGDRVILMPGTRG